MKHLFFPLVLLVLLSACSKPDASLQSSLTSIDSVAINFFPGNGSVDTVVGVTIIREPQEIEHLITEVAAVQASTKKPCSPQGSLHFFRRGQVVQDMEIGITGCDLLSYTRAGKRRYTRIGTTLAGRLNEWRNSLKRSQP